MFNELLLSEVRQRFCHVDACPYQGPRVFFENAGGSLTLKSVVEANTRLAAFTDKNRAFANTQEGTHIFA